MTVELRPPPDTPHLCALLVLLCATPLVSGPRRELPNDLGTALIEREAFVPNPGGFLVRVGVRATIHVSRASRALIDWNSEQVEELNLTPGINELSRSRNLNTSLDGSVSLEVWSNGRLQGRMTRNMMALSSEGACGPAPPWVEPHLGPDGLITSLEVIHQSKFLGSFDLSISSEQGLEACLCDHGSHLVSKATCAPLGEREWIQMPSPPLKLTWPPDGWEHCPSRQAYAATVRYLGPFGQIATSTRRIESYWAPGCLAAPSPPEVQEPGDPAQPSLPRRSWLRDPELQFWPSLRPEALR